MDLSDLRGMPKVSGGKAPIARWTASTQGVGGAPPTEALKSSCKRPSDLPVPLDDPSRRHKVEILSRRHKSHHGEGSRSHSKGKELSEPVEEPETLRESAEEDASLVFHRPRSMKDLFKTKVHKDDAGYYALHMSDWPTKTSTRRCNRDDLGGGGLKNSTKVWNDPSAMEEFERDFCTHNWCRSCTPSRRLITFMDSRITNLQQEIDALKSGGGPEAVSAVEERASELEKELKKIKREQDEALK
ncbi:hypothetical protein BHE74_00041251 [Ensete ventricosum]|nr:hypothetical protein BHE74_00041251 [Ensete ventricosum]